MMMKQVTAKISVFALFLFVSSVPASFAEDYNWGDKLTRGVVNVVTSPVEIPKTINLSSQADGPATGWTAGLVRGLGRTLLRAGAGVVEVATFPFDWPEEDKDLIIEPKYAWQEWNETVLD